MSDPTSDALPRVGVRELRNQVAAVVRRAGAGERIVITVDGEPVAQLGPLSPTASPTLDDLVAAGLAQPPRRADRPAPPDPVDPPVDARTSSALDALRGGAER
ncbi:type II toxin-antitoxin system Phd/YefM family antitoxin [Actinomarinicola tropica]|uniref:type II toxin-antitoxin system Phd/YefM family antitoxin n=1 Tax=Actinomarinicola tropica TaxID=2789776 RepID=UPI001E28C350|nr:type II toxin-antitoxin system prevent-host-death family antitoxin [Actinomarinicola tropica]